MKGYKGFDKDLKCRGFQYKIGETFEENIEPICCSSGFHFCEYPLDVFAYYDPATSRFCEVEALGKIDNNDEDSKVSTNKIRIGAELSFERLTKASIDFIYERVKKDNKKSAHKEEDRSVASNTGDRSVASNTGNRSVASNTGKGGIASSLGIESRAKGSLGTWVVLAEWVLNEDKYEYEVVQVKTVKVDGKRIKANTLYELINGKFKEVKEDE